MKTIANHVAGIPHHTTNYVMYASPVQFTQPENVWILDSGATIHITPYLHLVHNFKPVNYELHLPNREISIITHIGQIQLSSDILLQDVLVVPKFQCNLLFSP